jgi:hypothetical protein
MCAQLELKHKYKYRLILDESWSFGSIGKTGRGVTEYFDVPVSLCSTGSPAHESANLTPADAGHGRGRLDRIDGDRSRLGRRVLRRQHQRRHASGMLSLCISFFTTPRQAR